LIYLKQRRVRKATSIVAPGLLRDSQIGTILDPEFSPDSSAVYFLAQPSNFEGLRKANRGAAISLLTDRSLPG
jgi:hypothetical protein